MGDANEPITEEHLGDAVGGGLADGIFELEEDDQRHQGGGPAPHAVEDGHHLRHRRHWHFARRWDRHQRAKTHARAYYPIMARVLCEKRKNNREDHARDADQVAIASSAGRTQRLESQNEANGR